MAQGHMKGAPNETRTHSLCVIDRERERERERRREKCVSDIERVCVCVCACVSVRESVWERERESCMWERQREKETICVRDRVSACV